MLDRQEIIRQALLQLLRISLWGEPVDDFVIKLSSNEWEELYRLSVTQSVEALVGDAVKRLPLSCGLPAALAGKWLFDMNRTENAYCKMASIIERQRKLWKENSVEALLLKGHSVAAMYPCPQHRAIGDIDWQLCGTESWTRALRILREKALAYQYDSEGDVHYVDDGIVVELHRKGLNEDLLKDGLYPEACLCLLIEHVLNHAVVFGVGLKQFCDLAVAFKHYYGRYDPDAFVKLLDKCGLRRWSNVLCNLLVNYFGMSEELFPFSLRQGLKGDADYLMAQVFKDGNFGRAKNSRSEGLWGKWLFFLGIAPHKLLNHLTVLVSGRVKKEFLRKNRAQ